MQGESIFGPFMGMILLTFAVWVVMYVRRLTYLKVHKVDAQSLTTPERGAAIIPEQISYPAYNLRNLFELPVIFYALCLYLYVTGSAAQVDVIAAWAFFVFRALHSAIHCTVNIVMARFATYAVAALALWIMLARAVLNAWF